MIVQIIEKGENIVAKGEIGHHEPFILLSHCLQKNSAAKA